MLEKTRSRPKHRIEKHLLGIPEERRTVDTAYRQSFKERVCEASDNGIDLCGLPCVGAHVRAGEYAGHAQKPSDDLIVGLCVRHHAEQESESGLHWWMENVWKPMLRRRYREWRKK